MTAFNILKHATKITKKSGREILKNIYIDEGYLYATDSHRLLRFKNNLDLTNATIDPNTLQKVEEAQYPGVARLIPKRDFKKVLIIEDYLSILPFFKQQIDKEEDCVLFSYDHTTKRLEINNKQSKVKVEVESKLEKDFNIVFNRKYILDVLECFKDYEAKACFFQFEGEVRPGLFAADVDLHCLVTSVRVTSLQAFQNV